MHVLGLPPAFVLSQDQTLKLKSCCQLNLDVRTSAHRPGRHDRDSLCLLCFWFHKKPETVQTVKLTLVIGPKPYQRDIQTLIHRMNQTAHISLQILSISNSVETKSTGCALIFSARPACIISVFFLRLVAVPFPVWPVWRPVGASLRRR